MKRFLITRVLPVAIVIAVIGLLIVVIAGAISGSSSDGGASSSGMSSASLGDYNVYTESEQAAPVIEDIETLKKAFGGYASNSKLLAEAQTFLNMQNTYKVNAIFCAAVSIQETSAGTNGSYAIDGHNWFNYLPITGISDMDGYLGTQDDKWCKWETDADGIMGFGYYISKHTSCYFSQGEYTVSEIGSHYCVPPDNWITSVNKYMTDMYAAAGINVYGGTYAAGDSKSYVYGTFCSNFGRTFTIINQTGTLDGNVIFPSQCNRAAGLTILTAYDSRSVEDLIRMGQKSSNDGFPYANTAMFDGSGFTITSRDSEKDNYVSIVRTGLQQGSYYMIRFKEGSSEVVVNGVKFASVNGHWISILGYKLEDGKEQIFIADPGYGNSGWYNINTFTEVLGRMQHFFQFDPPN